MSSYLQYLIWMMLFVIVIEMIFPDSAYRKYIKLVLGCILMYTLLRPVVGLIQVDGTDYDAYVKKYQQILAGEVGESKSFEEEKERQQETLKTAYIRSMTDYVEQTAEVEVVWLVIDWREEQMQGIDLTIRKPSETLKIGEIHIGDKSETIDGDGETLKNKLKTCLSDFYNVQVQNINITVQKN